MYSDFHFALLQIILRYIRIFYNDDLASCVTMFAYILHHMWSLITVIFVSINIAIRYNMAICCVKDTENIFKMQMKCFKLYIVCKIHRFRKQSLPSNHLLTISLLLKLIIIS